MYEISSRQEVSALADHCLGKPGKQFVLKIEGDSNRYRVGADSEGVFKIDLEEHTKDGAAWKALTSEKNKMAFVKRLSGKVAKALPAEPMEMASDDDYEPLLPTKTTTTKKKASK